MSCTECESRMLEGLERLEARVERLADLVVGLVTRMEQLDERARELGARVGAVEVGLVAGPAEERR